MPSPIVYLVKNILELGVLGRCHDNAFNQSCRLQGWHNPAYRRTAYAKLPGKLFPSRPHHVRIRIHLTLEYIVNLRVEIKRHRWRSASRVDCCSMFVAHWSHEVDVILLSATLRALGVCSRIPHMRQICRYSHGQISTHVYILHIIPFLWCCWLSVVLVSIDFHPEKPCFSVRFVDTYSIHSFPPPSRRTQQIQGFQRSGVGVRLPARPSQHRFIRGLSPGVVFTPETV